MAKEKITNKKKEAIISSDKAPKVKIAPPEKDESTIEVDFNNTHRRIQTAEGWKRSMLKEKNKESRKVNPSKVKSKDKKDAA